MTPDEHCRELRTAIAHLRGQAVNRQDETMLCSVVFIESVANAIARAANTIEDLAMQAQVAKAERELAEETAARLRDEVNREAGRTIYAPM